jgi:hypothetical protein
MPDRVTLDVLDRPAGGALRALRRASALRDAPPLGMRALLAMGTLDFRPRVRPAPTPRRIAVLAAWEDGADSSALDELGAGAREYWHVEAEIVRAAFSESWKGWTPDVTDARPLDAAEPALVLISGELHPRFVPAFFKDAAGAVAHAFAHPGYLGGLAFQSSALNTTSCSCWRTYGDACDYAYTDGGHRDAMLRDRRRGHHRTEYFLRLRPLVERGSLRGSTPLAPVLSSVVPATSG